MVESTLRGAASQVPVKTIHASRGKRLRAEPVSALYEQGRVHHVGPFEVPKDAPQGVVSVEDQQCTWDASSGNKSPDRLDALVYAITELMIPEEPPLSVYVGRVRR